MISCGSVESILVKVFNANPVDILLEREWEIVYW